MKSLCLLVAVLGVVVALSPFEEEMMAMSALKNAQSKNPIKRMLFQPNPWSELKVTWGKFDNVPITESDAQSKGWTLSQACGTSAPQGCSGQWYGKRYQYKGDVATMLLFDQTGKLAGIQSGVTTSPTNFNLATNGGTFEVCGNYWITTMYFRDPTSICTSSPSGSSNPIGDRMVLRKGNGFITIPALEKDVLTAPGQTWTKGSCFWTMGQHYWWNVTPDMDCDNFFSIFLLYNRGALNGFGFNIAKAQYSSRWEHPHGQVLKQFFPSSVFPKCLLNEAVLSTQHVFTTSPYVNYC